MSEENTMSAEEYFKKEYGDHHIMDVIQMDDAVPLFALIEEYTQHVQEAKPKCLSNEKIECIARADATFSLAANQHIAYNNGLLQGMKSARDLIQGKEALKEIDELNK